MKLPLLSLANESKTVTVSEALFAVRPNLELIAQAIHVYRMNQRQGGAKTLRRGEVALTTKKMYRQKGTGRARHGAASAPIFVGGGVAHGPTGMENWKRSLPTVLSRKAVVHALSAQAQEKNVVILSDLEKLVGKTKEAAAFLKQYAAGKKHVTIVLDQGHEAVVRALKNIPEVTLTRASRLNTFEVASANLVMIMQPALTALEDRLVAKKENA